MTPPQIRVSLRSISGRVASFGFSRAVGNAQQGRSRSAIFPAEHSPPLARNRTTRPDQKSNGGIRVFGVGSLGTRTARSDMRRSRIGNQIVTCRANRPLVFEVGSSRAK